MTKGYVQVYTGNGKGKTSAALGLALRAAGAGLKVFIGQFIKERYTSEIKSLELFEGRIVLRQYGKGFCFSETPREEDIQAAQQGLQELQAIIASQDYQVVILDEINVALKLKLISLDQVLALIRNKPEELELVLTGRYAHPGVIEAADLVTEMKPIKHYAEQGVQARTGIEE